LTEGKSRFSEVAELALTRGPQEITVATKRPVVYSAKISVAFPSGRA
jgi:hypothetical protein